MQCRYWPDPLLPKCCQTDLSCDDNIDCTAESCNTDTNTCVQTLVPDQVPKCCWTAADCNDGNPSTTDTCNSNKECVNTSACGCNEANPVCNDSNVCTKGTCADCECSYAMIEDCCTKDEECPSYGKCMVPICILATNTCSSAVLYNCCENDSHCMAGGTWDDGNDCTLDLCIVGECRHIVTGDEC